MPRVQTISASNMCCHLLNPIRVAKCPIADKISQTSSHNEFFFKHMLVNHKDDLKQSFDLQTKYD